MERMGSECHIPEGAHCIGTCRHTVCLVARLVLKRKGAVLFSTVIRRGVPRHRRTYACLRSIASASFYALGFTPWHWSSP